MPEIFEVWTSARGRVRAKQVFAPGESIQWNIFHRADAHESGQAYELRFHLDRIGNASASSAEAQFDVLWPVHRTYMLRERSYDSAFQWDFIWREAIPDTSTIEIPMGLTREEALRGLIDADWNIAFLHGYWRFSAIVQMTEPGAGGAFASSETWMYRITE